MNITDQVLQVLPPHTRTMAVVPHGSDLYGTEAEFHDIDMLVVTRTGRPGQLIRGDLDIKLLPLRHLMFHAGHGALAESECLFALAAGHGEVLDPAWEPFFRSARAPLRKYASTVSQHRLTPQFRPKDGVRWDIFLDRAFNGGGTDPHLSPVERRRYFDELARL